MAELTTLARPYAKAAFEFAFANKDLPAWSKMLALLGSVVQLEKLQKILRDPSLTATQQAEMLLSVVDDELNEGINNFVRILAENKRLELLPEIYRLYEVLKAEVEKSLDVQVTSAYELEASTRENLEKALQKKFACEIKIESSIDKTLIGGVIVRAGDMIIDGSIRGRLTKLAEAINA